jgi:KDO2-lipid IV(A) lauroyltransferase
MRQYYLFRILTALTCALPLGLCYSLARLAGTLLSLVPAGRRDAARANLAVVYGTNTRDRRVRRDARRALQHWMLNWVDLFRLERSDAPRMVREIYVPSLQPIDDALALGKGVILISAHLGSFDTVLNKLAVRGDRVLVPVEQIEPLALMEYLREQRSRLGTRIEPIGPDTFRHLAAHLREGGIVVMVSDRDVQGTGQPVTFFGRIVSMPGAAFLLALRTGAPLLVAFGYRYEDNRITARVVTGAAIPLAGAGRRSLRAELAAATQAWAAIVEREIRRDPGQWVALQPVFDSAPARQDVRPSPAPSDAPSAARAPALHDSPKARWIQSRPAPAGACAEARE